MIVGRRNRYVRPVYGAAFCAVALTCIAANLAYAGQPIRQATAPIETLMSQMLVHRTGSGVLLSSVNARPLLPEPPRPKQRSIESPEDSAWLVAELNTKTREITFTIHWVRSGEQEIPEISAVWFTLPLYSKQLAPKPAATYSKSCIDGHSQSDEFNITRVYRRFCVNTVREQTAVARSVLTHLAQQGNDGSENLMTIDLLLTDANNAQNAKQFRFYPVEAQAVLKAVDEKHAALLTATVTVNK